MGLQSSALVRIVQDAIFIGCATLGRLIVAAESW